MRRGFLRHLDFKAWISFSISKQGPYFSIIEEDGDDKRFAGLELACEANGVAPPDNLAFAATAKSILMLIFGRKVRQKCNKVVTCLERFSFSLAYDQPGLLDEREF